MGARKFNVHNARTVGQKFEEKILELRKLYPIELKQNAEAWDILLAYVRGTAVTVAEEFYRLDSSGLLKEGRGDGYNGLPLNKKGVKRKPPNA